MKQKGKISGKKMKQMLVTYTFVLPDFIGLLVSYQSYIRFI